MVFFKASEQELIDSARAGDGLAFAELLEREYRLAFRLAHGLLQDIDEAEDAVQEAAFTAWRRISTLRSGSSLRPWLPGIVANQCRTVKRNRWWSVVKVEPPESEAPSTDLAMSIDLRRALRRIGHDERLILVLRYYLDLPFDEIALTLQISSKAARTRTERAIRRLRPMMQLEGAAV
jgi:RNA polymerase sigma-70 factor (ECF subfamily)